MFAELPATSTFCRETARLLLSTIWHSPAQSRIGGLPNRRGHGQRLAGIRVHRNDLILARMRSSRLSSQLIEVQFRSGAGCPAEEVPLKEAIVTKNAATQKALEASIGLPEGLPANSPGPYDRLHAGLSAERRTLVRSTNITLDRR